jgi:hypothetical protein
LGLAVLSSDVISSAAYATDELLLILLIGGSAALAYAIPLSAAGDFLPASDQSLSRRRRLLHRRKRKFG